MLWLQWAFETFKKPLLHLMTYKVQTVQIWNNMITEKTFKIRKTDDQREFISKYSKLLTLFDAWWKTLTNSQPCNLDFLIMSMENDKNNIKISCIQILNRDQGTAEN